MDEFWVIKEEYYNYYNEKKWALLTCKRGVLVFESKESLFTFFRKKSELDQENFEEIFQEGLSVELVVYEKRNDLNFVLSFFGKRKFVMKKKFIEDFSRKKFFRMHLFWLKDHEEML